MLQKICVFSPVGAENNLSLTGICYFSRGLKKMEGWNLGLERVKVPIGTLAGFGGVPSEARDPFVGLIDGNEGPR